MSRNMGKRTNPDQGHRVDSGWHESPGLVVRRFVQPVADLSAAASHTVNAAGFCSSVVGGVR